MSVVVEYNDGGNEERIKSWQHVRSLHTQRKRKERESNKIRFKLVLNYSPGQEWDPSSALELAQL